MKSINEKLMFFEKYTREETNNFGLFTGLCGYLLYASYIFKHTKDEKFYRISTELKTELIHVLNESAVVKNSFFTYCYGLAGVGVTMHYINNYIESIEIEEWDEIILPIIESQLQFFLNEKNYDFLHGYIGIGFYLLKVEKGKDSLIKIINTLNETYKQSKNGIYWEEFTEEEHNKTTRQNLSLSHGSASILIFLCKAYKKGIMPGKTRKLCINTAKNIISTKFLEPRDGHYFPSTISPNTIAKGARISWCYGDIGTCLSLIDYADTFKDNDVKELCLKILSENANKRGNVENSQFDAGICHGTAGLAMIFRRLYMRFKFHEFKEAYEYWFVQTKKFENLDSDDPYIYYFGSKVGFKNTKELLTGYIGTDMVIFSIENNTNQSWDTLFLLS